MQCVPSPLVNPLEVIGQPDTEYRGQHKHSAKREPQSWAEAEHWRDFGNQTLSHISMY